MKHPYSEEILSAYVDGELTDQERAEVEHWLESSPGARERLEDFRGLSRLFASLPRTEVPQEFPTKVLQLAERRMLLPEASANSPGRRRRRWMIAVGAPLASAAVLLICLKLPFRDPAPGHPGGRSLPSPVVANGTAPDFANGVRHGGTAEEERFVAANTPGATQSKLAQADSPQLPAQAAGADGDASKAVASGSTELLKSQAGGGAAREETRDYPQLAQIRQAMAEIREAGDDEKVLAVLRMRVVDESGGMLLLQRVLAENNVVASEEEERSLEKAGDGSAAKGEIAKSGTAFRGSRAAGNEALYVVAQPEQYIASFKAILEREGIPVQLSVEAPLELADLNAESRKQFSDLFLRPSLRQPERPISIGGEKDTEAKKARPTTDEGTATEAPKADRSANAFPAPPTGVEKRAEKKPGEGKPRSQGREMLDSNRNGSADKASDAEGAKQAAGAARQFVVPLPRELKERQSRAAATARRRSPEAPSRQVASPPPSPKPADDATLDGKNRGEGESSRRAGSLVRVLIVIDRGPAPPGAAPAAQPAAGKGPGGT